MDIQRLLETHQNAVFGICFRVLRHPQDAEDACQDALVEAARHARELRDPKAFGPWLRRVALTSALDLRRKRERRRLRDAGFMPPAASADPDVELHEAIADLDDDTRWVVLEHYYEGRPLRTLASEAGVSEVAMWKRLEKGRERLRARLAPTAFAALGACVLLTVPEGLARKAWAAVEATAIMKKVAIAALLLLPPALVGVAALISRPASPPPRESTAYAPAPKPTVLPDEAPPVVRAVPAAAAVVEAPPHKPWPLEFPAPGWPEGVKRGWEALMRRVTIDVQNVSLADLITHISREIKYPIGLDAGVGGGEISFKVHDIVVDGALKLTLQPRQMGYELREDGTILVRRRENLDPALRNRWNAGAILDATYHLGKARQQLDGGGPVPSLRTAEEALRKTVVLPPGARHVEEALESFRSSVGVPILIDAGKRKRLEGGRALPPLQGDTLEIMLLLMLEADDFVPVPSPEGVILLTTRDRAPELQNSPEVQAARRLEAGLEHPPRWREPVGVPGAVERLERDLGVQVIASREAWEGAAVLAPQEGETLRSFLDRFSAWGVRWTVRNGTLFLIR